jgi:hypothetical protein
MSTLGDKDLVRICLEEVSKKMGYADYSALSQREYEHLCQLIEEKTGILISLSTIKRIFAGKFERLPQGATLHALTLFAGYEGWQDFKTRKLHEQSASPVAPVSSAAPVKPSAGQEVQAGKQKTRKRAIIQATAAFLVLAGMGMVVFLFSLKQKEVEVPEVQEIYFSAKRIVAEGVPNSVVFSYNIDKVPGDSFFIQQSWDPGHRIAIKKNNYTQTDIYYEPGYHRAKLISNNQILKEIDIHIPTKDWIAYSKTPADRFPQYFKNAIIHENVLGLTRQDLEEHGLDVKQDRDFYYAFFPEGMNVNSDYFTWKARIRMYPVKPTRCAMMAAALFTEQSLMYFTCTIPGCISEINAVFGDKYISGKTSDLSGLGRDLLNWQEVEVKVVNRRVRICIQGKQVLEEQYSQPSGMIKGMGFISNGLCEVDWVELQDSTAATVYRNDFHQ